MGEPNDIDQFHPVSLSPSIYNLPVQDLLDDNKRRDFINICVPLSKASMKGDWKTAKSILNCQEHLVRYSITENCETAVHIAAAAQRNTKSINFVQHLVGKMEKADLQLQNRQGNTALCLAAAAGNVEIAKIMVKSNEDLPTIANGEAMRPLFIAVLFRHHEMVNYLYHQSQRMGAPDWTPKDRKWVFLRCIELDLWDFALKILKDYPLLAQCGSALGALARKPSAFNESKQHCIWRIINPIICLKREHVETDSKAMQILRKIWTRIEEKPKAEIDKILRGPKVLKDGIQTYPSRILFVAAEMGNTKFLVELISRYPDLMWKKNENNQSIFHVAVSHRHEDIYNLLYEIGSMKALIISLADKDGNNMLHLVGKKAEKRRDQDVSGVVFQMQLDLIWFKEVESMIPPLYKEQKNTSGLTPYELFTLNHTTSVIDGEIWMKGTASKCTLVATLIATIVFAVAYTIPGGYDQNDGFPMFLHNGPFLLFVVLDAISFILSSISILVFLSILTCRYTQEDFRNSLPEKLLVGLSMLFLSIVTMMISFSVNFFVLYRHRFITLAIFVSLVAIIPIVSYAYLQYPLLKDAFRSTYGSKFLFRPKEQMLYYHNPRF
ncbi:uncharacterized protein LOC111886046 [Lactuca sativa]|uniref:PGG domain-containing protein n=1 Tax=Lactuca sativa TaxID=4236 RepID=A0A9R1XW29_LACSA|nr:uncharacterized protein LOC111886046 [Lactuca sativa]KAJ0228336.1 hypothetical protein LSAT_V11C100024860 [Lactuca sativa]